jgi:hypothetical protein
MDQSLIGLKIITTSSIRKQLSLYYDVDILCGIEDKQEGTCWSVKSDWNG